MSGGFGLTPSESFASFDPVSVSLKTRQLSLALMMEGPSQESSVDWPNAGMMCCGESFPLLPWVQDISESESASLLPTVLADASASQRSTNFAQGGTALGAKVRNNLLPTPICNDGKGSDYCYGKDHKKILKLPGKVKAELLPTSRASAGEARSTKPTPSQLAGKHGKYLSVVVRILPTPTTRDHKDTPGMAQESATGRVRLDQLPRVIFAAESPAPIGGMKLTPEFQCWLMGYPPDWLKPLRDALETALCRKSSPRSSKPSGAK